MSHPLESINDLKLLRQVLKSSKISSKTSSMLLQHAVASKNVDAAKTVLKFGNIKNINRFYPLSLAVQNNDLEMIHLLLLHGADPDLKDKNDDTAKDLASRSLLFAALELMTFVQIDPEFLTRVNTNLSYAIRGMKRHKKLLGFDLYMFDWVPVQTALTEGNTVIINLGNQPENISTYQVGIFPPEAIQSYIDTDQKDDHVFYICEKATRNVKKFLKYVTEKMWRYPLLLLPLGDTNIYVPFNDFRQRALSGQRLFVVVPFLSIFQLASYALVFGTESDTTSRFHCQGNNSNPIGMVYHILNMQVRWSYRK